MNFASKKIDGRLIANQILYRLKQQIDDQSLLPKLHIIIAPGNAVSEYYVRLKKKRAEEIGIQVIVHELSELENTDDVINRIEKINSFNKEGLIVQLPLPPKFETKLILDSISPKIDVDQLNRSADEIIFTQPVAGSVAESLSSIGFDAESLQKLPQRSIHVVGKGFLVGQPVISMFNNMNIEPVVYEKGDDLGNLKNAKIIITGAGVASLVSAEMVPEGVVLIDAGTSSDSGELTGDIDRDAYEKSSFYTPVPGGIGSITLAKLFENVVILATNES